MTQSDYAPARRTRGGGIDADTDSPAANPGAVGHDEWLLDEAIEETFPASDPPAPVRPGSSISMRYAYADASRKARRRVRVRRASAGAIVLASSLLFFLFLAARRK
jgi:hypothetical protein